MMDDEDEWQEMPTLRSNAAKTKLELEEQYRQQRAANGEYSDEDDDYEGEDQSEQAQAAASAKGEIPSIRVDKSKLHQPQPKKKKPKSHLDDSSSSGDSSDAGANASGSRLRSNRMTGVLKPRKKRPKDIKKAAMQTGYSKTVSLGSPNPSSNATGDLIRFDDDTGQEWREKAAGMDEQDYTRLELDDDPEEDAVHSRTQYLFDDDKGMTPLSQMQTTKQMLTEGQRIAYVGLCRLVMREMAVKWKAVKELEPAVESLVNWSNKIIGRLYQHMEIEPAEQRMIELLAEHGVTAMDLVPSLVATHTIANPNYDPLAEQEAIEEAEEEARIAREEEKTAKLEREKAEALAGQIKAMELQESERPPEEPPEYSSTEGDTTLTDNVGTDEKREAQSPAVPKVVLPDSPTPADPTSPTTPTVKSALQEPLPTSLPGASTNVTAADKTVTLDIRWTILCDLFLALIADSVYDARSRVLMGRIADQLGLTWMDVVRFERKLTEALEIQEGMAKRDNTEAIDSRAKADKRRRYVMMGLATLGGGLVLGLSAGLLAPAIGAGIAGALTTVGVSGGTAFLGGAGGAAVITTGGVLTGSSIGGRGMARRTKAVTKFEFQPLHNNKRLNAFVTVPGFMNGPQDDVRLPFSVMDPLVGDVYSVLWEPETLGQTGNALKILTSEVLSSVGQQVLQATLLGAMMSALQWPIILTKLGYLIDNPWSNALDRARQAGEVLAEVLIQRYVGVRPISLIGFSLGARVCFYTLVALAKRKAYGVVQECYLMGATVTASRKTWREIRGVVSGRFVNAYARNDWVLGYLYRATTGGLQTVAGLRPVEFVPDLENVDITELLAGHMSYRSLMPVILKEVGFRVTADSFDEPEDLDAPDREIVTPEVELARLEAKKKASWLARFKKDKSTPSTRRGSAVSNATSTGSGAPNGDKAEEEGDEADLPPRQAHAYKPYDVMPDEPSKPTSTDASPKDAGVGFDLRKIREQIAEDDGSGQLPAVKVNGHAARASIDATSPTKASHLQAGSDTAAVRGADLVRAPSAPPARPNILGHIGRSDTQPGTGTAQAGPSQAAIEAEKAQRALEAQEEEYERDLQRRLKEEAVEMARVAELEEAAEARQKELQTPKASNSEFRNPFETADEGDFGDFSSSEPVSQLAGYAAFPATSQASLADAGFGSTAWGEKNSSKVGDAWRDPWSGGDAWR